jgi:NTP pyrophosphatase (non-canonical NTP hydrolase)
MSMKDIQQAVDVAVSSQTKEGHNPYWPNLNIYARLGEEQGEIGRELNHLSGVKPKKPDEKPTTLGGEIGDAIFTLTCLANSNGIDLDVEVQKAIDKCYGRDKDRFRNAGAP